MAKDKNKKSGKKKGKAEGTVLATFKTLGNNQLVADVVAAALVATAAALKDPNKARRFASEAGDQLEKMSKDGAERGGAMWKLALDVGRRAIDAMGGETPATAKRAKPAKPAKPARPVKPAKPAKPAKTKAASSRATTAASKTKAPAAKTKSTSAKPKAKRASPKPKAKRAARKA